MNKQVCAIGAVGMSLITWFILSLVAVLLIILCDQLLFDGIIQNLAQSYRPTWQILVALLAYGAISGIALCWRFYYDHCRRFWE